MRVFTSLADFANGVGEHLGHSDWLAVDQGMITAFGAVTGDQQWIHCDPARAATGPYGSTIAHGYLILSLLPLLAAQVYEVHGVSATINYGLDRVRFPSPVRVGSRIRGAAEVISVDPGSGGATQAVVRLTVEVEGEERPACVADTVRRFVPEEGEVDA